MSPISTTLIVEIRIHADSGAFNSTHGNIEQAIVNTLRSVGHSDPRVKIVHYKKVDEGIVKVVVHQRITDASVTPIIGCGERTEVLEARIERELRKVIGRQPSVRFTRDAMPAYQCSHGEMKQCYARPAPGRNPATNGRQAQARM